MTERYRVGGDSVQSIATQKERKKSEREEDEERGRERERERDREREGGSFTTLKPLTTDLRPRPSSGS